MTTTERMLIVAIFGIMIGLISWLLATVSVNSSRISVLEQRTSNHTKAMDEFKLELRDHRQSTELPNGRH
jgi:hypothetical protein